MNTYKIKSSMTELISRAQSMADVSAIDSAIEEPLERLLRSLNTEAELSESGAHGMEQHILRVLSNRLRMQNDLRRYPEIKDEKIIPPLVITGGPRSGSTKLHKILAAGGDFIYLQCWEGMNFSLRTGRRGEDTDARIRDAQVRINWFNEHSPQSRLIHEFSTFEPEEENLIFEHRLYAPYMAPFLKVPTYIEWYMANVDYRGELEYLKQVMQYLQWQFHAGDPRPWLLKNPGYLGYEHLIAEAFPGVTLATTHRDPVSVVSSGSSLNTYFHRAYSEADRRATMGKDVMEGIAASWNAHMKVRDGHPGLNVLDIGYAELTHSVDRVLEKVYAHAGMPVTDKSRGAMRAWEDDNKIHKHGLHKHSLEPFGLTPDAIRKKFDVYIERFKAFF